MKPSSFFSKSVLLVSVFCFSLSSFASQTRFDLQEETQPFSQSLPVKSVKKHQDHLLIYPDAAQSQPSSSYLSSLGNMASSVLDSVARLVIKGYGLYTIVALPFVSAFDSNLRSGSSTQTSVMTNYYTEPLTKENCLPSFNNPHICDQFDAPEEQYSALVARYHFLAQHSSYLEMEDKVENSLKAESEKHKRKGKRYHKANSQKASSKTSIPLNQNVLIGAGVGVNQYQGILGAHIGPRDVKIYNVGAGNGVVVRSQTNIGDGINPPRGVHVNWMIDMGSQTIGGTPRYFDNLGSQDYNGGQITILKNDIRDQFCPRGLNESNYGVIVVTHPDADHYNWIPDILDLCYERESARANLIPGEQLIAATLNPFDALQNPFQINAKNDLPARAGWVDLLNENNNANHNRNQRNRLRDYLYWVFPETYHNTSIINGNFFGDGTVRQKLRGYLPDLINLVDDRRIRLDRADLNNLAINRVAHSFYFVNIGWDNSIPSIVNDNKDAEGHRDRNRTSIIMRLRPHNHDHTVLITGDATGDTLLDMLAPRNNFNAFVFNNNLLDINHAGPIRTLLVPHHGAETDGSNLLLNSVNLRNDADIIFSANGRFGHPRCSSVGLAGSRIVNNLIFPPNRLLRCHDVNNGPDIAVTITKDVRVTTELVPGVHRFNR